MPEKYGVYAQLVPSVASTPVDASTNIVFIGAAQIENVEGWANMDLINRPIYISSLSDYEKKLGGSLASACSTSPKRQKPRFRWSGFLARTLSMFTIPTMMKKILMPTRRSSVRRQTKRASMP